MNCRRGRDCQNRGERIRVDPAGDERDPTGNEAQVENAAHAQAQAEGDGVQAQVVQQAAAAQVNRFWERWPLDEAQEWTNNTYKEVVAFSPANLFVPPSCNATKRIIEEKSRLIKEYVNASPIAHIALKTLAIIPHLFFQRTHKNAKKSDNIRAVQRRIEKWNRGEVDELVQEAKAIQSRLGKRKGKK